jgi:hypothetical protein
MEEFGMTAKAAILRHGPKSLELTGLRNVMKYVKASKAVNLLGGKSFLLRDIVTGLTAPGRGWWGRRTKILSYPGSSRDASMADPDTLVKIKLSYEIFYKLCETDPNSAMCSHLVQEKRISRLHTNKLFLHFDFKKIGLYLPRRYLISVMQHIGDVYDIDVSWFDFNDLYIESEGHTYATKRGYALGWMNEGVTLVIIYIMRSFLKKYQINFDFLVFNDDVEIGFPQDLPESEQQLIRTLLINYFQEADIACSVKKIFFSKVSIFLEEYYSPGPCKFSLEKRSLATRIYAKAACCSYPFLRKSYVNIASQLWFSDEITRQIISNTRAEFPASPIPESRLPFELGGFFTYRKDGFNTLLVDFPNLLYMLPYFKIDVPIETTQLKTGFDSDKSFSRKQKKIRNALEEFDSSQLPFDEIEKSWQDFNEDKVTALVDTLPDGHNLKEGYLTAQFFERERVEKGEG